MKNLQIEIGYHPKILMIEKAERRHSRLFIFIATMFGLDVSVAGTSYISRLCLTVIFVMNAVVAYLTAGNSAEILEEHASCARVASLFDDLISVPLLSIVLWLNTFKRDELVRLFESSKQSWTTHAFLILLCVPFTIVNVCVLAETIMDRDVWRNLFFVSRALRPFVRTFVIMMYLEVVSSLQQRAGSLQTAFVSPATKLDMFIAARWRIRDEIDSANRLFSTIFGLLYIQIFLGTVSTLGRLATGERRLYCAIYLVGQSCFLVKLYWAAHQSSKLTELFMDIERCALQRQVEISSKSRGQSTTLPNSGVTAQWQVLILDDKWDSLRVACFVHRRATLVSFLATCVTCVAVVLQFDFKVVRMLNDLAQKYGKQRMSK